MATARRSRVGEPLLIHHDHVYDDNTEEETEDAMDESRDPLEESGCPHSDDSDDEIEETVAEDIRRFEQTFQDINKRYRLINRIGEGNTLAARSIPSLMIWSRHILYSLQGRRPAVRSISERMGH